MRTKITRRKSTDFTDTILRAYFGEPVDPPTLADAIRRLDLESAGFDDPPHSELEAAVAEVLLDRVKLGLPQWAMVGPEGVSLGRRPHTRHPRLRRYGPQFLFEINWANSGPGFSWPMAYHAIFVGWANRVVVTASSDTVESYGWIDFAIGHFAWAGPEGLVSGIRDIIIADWSQQASAGQHRFEDMVNFAGDYGTLACQWSDEVAWPGEEHHG